MLKNSEKLGNNQLTYNARVCMFYFVRCYTQSLKNFKSSHWLYNTSKTTIILIDEGNNVSKWIIPIKENESISHSQIFSDTFDTDFNLIKYVMMAKKLVKNMNDVIVVFTNTDIDVKNCKLDLIKDRKPHHERWYNKLQSIEVTQITQDTYDSFNDAKYYKFNNCENVVKILKRQAITLADDEVQNQDTNFADIKLLTKEEIRNALNHIIFAVLQPNENELKEIIKGDLIIHLKLKSVETIYNKIEQQVKEWFDSQDAFEILSSNVQTLLWNYKDAFQFFQKHIQGFFVSEKIQDANENTKKETLIKIMQNPSNEPAASSSVQDISDSINMRKNESQRNINENTQLKEKKQTKMKEKQTTASKSNSNAYNKPTKINNQLKTSGAQGITYEARLSMLIFVRGYIRGLKNFNLRYQVAHADKFDDVIFDEGGENYQMIQLKHKKKEDEKKISHRILFNEKFSSDYSLLKYVQSIVNANETDEFRNKIKAAVLYTNIEIEVNGNNELDLKKLRRPIDKEWYGDIESVHLTLVIPDATSMFDTSMFIKEAKYYKFTDDPNIFKILKRQAETFVKDKKNQIQTLTEDQITEALKKIIYAVQQPNAKTLEEMIKTEMINNFQLHSADSIYNELEKRFRNWCDTRDPFNLPSSSKQLNDTKQEVLSYEDSEEFFQKSVKNFSFGVTAPTNSFTGRKQELEKIKKKLNEKSNTVIITQNAVISGLGGVGKTQLTKQFIKEFGKSEFYGRVIWIEAESNESVAKSFRQIAQKINIENVQNKDIEVIIDEVFQYFEGFKVLFVFDNFDKSPINEGNLVFHCRRSASNPAKTSRPYLLFTSRNREILPGVPLLDLNVLSPEDAVQLIEREIKEISHTREDAEKLASGLQYFPLAIQQSVAFMKEQQQKSKVFGKTYKIQDYFIKYEEETQALLNYRYPDDFGEYGKTTFITWNVTFDSIKADEENGENAIKVLKLLAYLYADKIDSKMFLSLFGKNQEKTANAILLLEKYSMITKLEQGGSHYQIHRLVQAVIRLKFKEDEEDLFEQTMHLVYPELFKEYHSNDWDKWNDLIEKCSTEQIIHFKNLELHINKHERMKEKYKWFFRYLLEDSVLLRVALDGDVEKLKALNVSKECLQEFIKKNIATLIFKQSNKIIEYFLENDFLGLNDEVVQRYSVKYLIKCALDKNNVDLFKYLVEKCADLNNVLQFASVEFIVEIRNGKTDSLQNLMENQSEINCKTLEECLFYATVLNQESIVDLLVKNNIKPSFELNNWMTPYTALMSWSPLFVAAKLNYSNVMKNLTSSCDKEDFKKCLFQFAKDKNFTDKNLFEKVLNDYLQKGGDVNGQDEEGNTILYWATKCLNDNTDNLEIIHFLLDSGADPTVTNKYGRNALANILYFYNPNSYYNKNNEDFVSEIRKVLYKIIPSISTPEKFIRAVANGLCQVDYWTEVKKFTAIFDQLLKQIGDINVQSEKGETVQIKYCQTSCCKVKTVEFLLEKGAVVNAKDIDGKSALYYSVEFGGNDVFEYLLPKVKSVDENVLLNAIKHNRLRIVKILYEKHFSPDHKFRNGKTAIEVAMEFMSLEVVLFMKPQFIEYLDQGGNINKRDKDGNTLLLKFLNTFLWKRYDGDIDDVKFLVERGIDVNATDIVGRSALFYAVRSDEDDIFLYLVDKVSSVDENVLYYAIRHNELSIVKSLIPKHFQKYYRFINLEGEWKKYNNYTPLDIAKQKTKKKQIENYLKNL